MNKFPVGGGNDTNGYVKGLPASCLLRTGGQQNIVVVLRENNMKTKRTHRHTGANWQGKSTSATLGQEKTRSAHSSHAHIKPFAGKVFYLDLPSNRITESLESDIKEQGGTVEKFFSKEIKYLVTNKREARYVLCLRQNSPVPSPDSGPSSPHPCSNLHQPGSYTDKAKNTFRDQMDTLVTSRGKSLVDRVVKERERVQVNKILSNALDWGVKILYIDDILAYLEKKKKAVCSQCPPAAAAVVKTVKAEPVAKQRFQKCKAGRISKPFVKVEDSSKHYRPIYLTMPSMPQFNLKNVPPFSPFLVEEKCPVGNKQPGHRGVKASASEEKRERKKNRDKRGGGYCECCMIKYGNATMHLQSECHKAFSKSDKYLVLDRLISTMQWNFSNILNQVKRPKHSISSLLAAPGPCVNPEVRHEADVDAIEMIKGQHRTTNVHKDFCSGPALKEGTFPASAALIHREEGRRSDVICSYIFKDKSLGCIRMCRQNSLTSYAQRASGPKNETASCRGELVDSLLSKVADSVDQASEYSSNSTSHRESDSSSKFLCAATNQQAMSDVKQYPSAFESVRDQSTLDDKIAENNLPEREEGRPTIQSCSPVPKIKRRIRVYKRRRLKVDTHFGPDNSRLKLWEMFQSSEDMDVEFLGFDDSVEGND